MKRVKIISVLALTVAIMLSLIACGGNKDLSLIKDMTTEHISRISVSTLPTLFDTVELTDTSEIENIIQYLKELNPGRSSMNADINGMAYQIMIFNDDGTETTVALSGNKYVRINDNAARTIPYDEATLFDTVIGNILINRYRDEYTGTIVRGEVISVSSAESGATVGCEIKADDGTLTVVAMSDVMRIIDITGTGWLILHAGDIVEIGIDSNSVADKVFITEAAM